MLFLLLASAFLAAKRDCRMWYTTERGAAGEGWPKGTKGDERIGRGRGQWRVRPGGGAGLLGCCSSFWHLRFLRPKGTVGCGTPQREGPQGRGGRKERKETNESGGGGDRGECDLGEEQGFSNAVPPFGICVSCGQKGLSGVVHRRERGRRGGVAERNDRGRKNRAGAGTGESAARGDDHTLESVIVTSDRVAPPPPTRRPLAAWQFHSVGAAF